MAEEKTQPTKASVDAFLRKATKGDRLSDCQTLVKLMSKASGAKPVMWGSAIIGFGTYSMTYADGRTNDWPIVALSPRATSLVLYGIARAKGDESLLKQLGKFKTAGGCLHIKALADVETKVLGELIAMAVKAKA